MGFFIVILLSFLISYSNRSSDFGVGLSMCGFEGELTCMLEQELMVAIYPEHDDSKIVQREICNGGVLSECILSSSYGPRIHPIFHNLRFHHGIDLAAKSGMQIFAPADGIIEFTGRRGGYGLSIIIDHNYGWKSRYAHLKKLNVNKSEYVRKGDFIGEVGSTGLSTGPHLHFELHYMEKTVDPRIYFSMLNSFGSLLAWKTSKNGYM